MIALPCHVEVEYEAGEAAIGKIGEQRVPERIVLLEQDQDGKIGHITERPGGR